MNNYYQIVSNKKLNIFDRFSVTTNLIIANIFFFSLFSLLLKFKVLSLEYIALNPYNILQGKYLWTILTSMFMHAGIFHIFVNMLSLFFVGVFTEKILGRKRYFYLYMISGLFASLFFVLSAFILPSDMLAYAVGASGAIFGLLGLLMILTPDLPVYLLFVPIPIKMKYAAPGMLALLWVFSIGLSIPIGNTAHLGGFLVGLFYGLYLKKNYKNKTMMIRKMFR